MNSLYYLLYKLFHTFIMYFLFIITRIFTHIVFFYYTTSIVIYLASSKERKLGAINLSCYKFVLKLPTQRATTRGLQAPRTYLAII